LWCQLRNWEYVPITPTAAWEQACRPGPVRRRDVLLGIIIGNILGPAAAGRGDNLPGIAASALVRQAHAAELLRVLDGDTFEARVRLWPGLDVTTKVRLRGVDAPELHARCFEERERAEAARDALKRILGEGQIGLSQVTLDKYGGRVVAMASTVATPDVSSALIAAGVGRPYAGGRRQGWCDKSDDFSGLDTAPGSAQTSSRPNQR
jgi:endonuclease YncB( thermonuclease family)